MCLIMNQKGFIYTGNLLQTVNYYPSGVPFTLTDDDPVTDRLHTGKPFPSRSIIAHEFKHSSQFDTGELSLSEGKTYKTPLLYDKIDEVEAYKRGSYYGGPKYSIDNLPQLYVALSDTQRNCFNVNELKQYVGINLSEKHVNQLKHRLRTTFQQAVRFNGTTYY